MVSKLIVVPVEKIQERIDNLVKGFEGGVGVYVSLNKTQKSLQEHFKGMSIRTDKVFFIDGVTKEKTHDEVLHISPNNLEELEYAIGNFLDQIHGEKFLLIDALSTLLIYNNENRVAAFIKNIIHKASKNTSFIALTPETKGEELLKKIFNFFDKVDSA